MNNRIIENVLENKGSVCGRDTAPIITRHNKVKDLLNIAGAKTFAKRHNKEYNVYYAQDFCSQDLITNEALQSYLYNLHTGQTDQMMGVLPLVEGMPVIFTHNYDVHSGIVNGTEGFVKKSELHIRQNRKKNSQIMCCNCDGHKMSHTSWSRLQRCGGFT